ncbi:hypothetical protein INT43_003770 [Umbelopsis isabellina]|uniref:Uncharacterized protein n=1 Tax=Mortierella isabellina TaxID=91625 RepID=A0A8H7PUA4_MORIS|nr:hypothetical protein INT43_003770 [Umbelopsis isabellina]
MGCCQSTEDIEGRQRSDEIDSQLKRDRMNMKSEIKMLLLGAGESGKSTILKQMKLIHDGGYTTEERESFKEVIFSNTIQSMRVTLEAMEMMGLQFQRSENYGYKLAVMDAPAQIDGTRLESQLADAIYSLWADPAIKQTVARANEFQLNDSARYYFDSIERIGHHNYLPTDQDVLRSRVKTTGITETTFVIKNLTYRMFDVGGQRSERKKWIHCFENVTAIIFLIAISEYDQVLIEDETVVKSHARSSYAIRLNLSVQRETSTQSVRPLFPRLQSKYLSPLIAPPWRRVFDILSSDQGPDTYDAASEYILKRFVSLNQSSTKQVYTHFTCATDTQQIKFVMDAVNDIIVHNNLRDVGLL